MDEANMKARENVGFKHGPLFHPLWNPPLSNAFNKLMYLFSREVYPLLMLQDGDERRGTQDESMTSFF